ncbi:MAG: hypothetical protein DWQ36_25840 [Acidobacteria bacterium]|nr:MAG: hypothetical protein DWQ30_17665 [Acidobacteriota bacterium]REJ99435.1 MAG: hypothetical protein DWQ36_25840 [Acidobacteriota bacterium]
MRSHPISRAPIPLAARFPGVAVVRASLSTTLLAVSLLALSAAARGQSGDSASASLPPHLEADREVLEFLLHAEPIAEKVIEGSINRPRKLLLERGGERRAAIFREVHRTVSTSEQHHRKLLRDHYVFERAAYELDRLLGIGRVPPTVLREIDGQEGSLQLWIDDARPGSELLRGSAFSGETGTARRDSVLREMALFDSLVRNFDRHLNNLLVDDDARVWWIDHTRTFPPLGELEKELEIDHCSTPLYQRLESVDTDAMRHAVRTLLRPEERLALAQRHQSIVRHCHRLLTRADAQP